MAAPPASVASAVTNEAIFVRVHIALNRSGHYSLDGKTPLTLIVDGIDGTRLHPLDALHRPLTDTARSPK